VAKDRRVQLLLTVFARRSVARRGHGTPLAGALRGAYRRGRHCGGRGGAGTISGSWCYNTAYWKNAVRRRLTRDETVTFPRSGANFPALAGPAHRGAMETRRRAAQA